MDQLSLCLPGLSSVCDKEIVARFDGGRLSSDGVVLLCDIEARLGVADRLAACLADGHAPARITHTYAEMIRARSFANACGSEDCDNLDVLRFDPVSKTACGRLPETGGDLAAQPTLSRLDNLPSWRALARMRVATLPSSSDRTDSRRSLFFVINVRVGSGAPVVDSVHHRWLPGVERSSRQPKRT